MGVCGRQKELISLQHEALQKAVLASKKNGERKALTERKIKDAVQEKMISPSFTAYASGFKAIYCNFFCPLVCENPYDQDLLSEPEQYDLWRIRDKMTYMGLLPLYAEIEPEIRTEVFRHKYFSSLKRNDDVGWDFAEESYIDLHLKDFIEGTTACFVEVGLKWKNLERILAIKE